MLSTLVAPPRMWARALLTVPSVDLRQVDAVSRWLILMRASVVVMTATSALIGGLLAVRGEAFHAGLLALTTLGLVLCHAASNLTNDLWDFRRGVDTPDSPRATYGPHALAHDASSWGAFLLVTGAILAAAFDHALTPRFHLRVLREVRLDELVRLCRPCGFMYCHRTRACRSSRDPAG